MADAIPFLTVRSDDVDWRPSRHPGIRFRPLRYDRDSGASAFILEMDPGSSYPAHRHTHGEDVFVLDGELITGSGRHGPGSYIHGPPGSVHAPRTEKGCRMFIVLPGRVEEIAPEGAS